MQPGRVSSPLTYASAITYHPNGMVHKVTHANGVVDTQTLASHGMARPDVLSAANGAGSLWNTGTYAYDGAGNIKKIGFSYFTYDKVSRLTLGAVHMAQGQAAANLQTQGYTFDSFGNIQSITTQGVPQTTATSSATNRLTTGSVYDASGNLTSSNANTYEWDALDMMKRYRAANGEEWTFFYSADEERLATIKTGNTDIRWTLRGFDHKVLREYQAAGNAWSIQNDYIYRASQLLATETPAGVRHFTLDHLGMYCPS